PRPAASERARSRPRDQGVSEIDRAADKHSKLRTRARFRGSERRTHLKSQSARPPAAFPLGCFPKWRGSSILYPIREFRARAASLFLQSFGQARGRVYF